MLVKTAEGRRITRFERAEKDRKKVLEFLQNNPNPSYIRFTMGLNYLDLESLRYYLEWSYMVKLSEVMEVQVYRVRNVLSGLPK